MPIICPAILARDTTDYEVQVSRIALFARRIQIDITDAVFARSKTVGPKELWWPAGIKADIHMMYAEPLSVLSDVLAHLPNMIIVHAEADGDFKSIVSACRHQDVKVGLALLETTAPAAVYGALPFIDHVMIFSGHLGHFGGNAHLGQIDKIKLIRAHRPNIEIGWDGGVNADSAAALIKGGVDVLNVGGYIQKADDPAKSFAHLEQMIAANR